ncbi:MAG: c-type cytochrome [Chloroflexota bacterium]
MKKVHIYTTLTLLILLALIFTSCGWIAHPALSPLTGEPPPKASPDAANGERIYFTSNSARGSNITYRGGPNFGRMMMGAYLTCASCHGPEAGGGRHMMMHMQIMDAPAITYAALSDESHHEKEGEHNDEHGEYTLDTFRMAVIEGQHPDGESLSLDMPRWQMSEENLSDLFAYLKSLSNENIDAGAPSQ